MPLMDDDDWAQLPNPLTLRAIALIGRMSETTVLRRLQDGTIPGYQFSGRWTVHKSGLRDMLLASSNQRTNS